MEIIHGTEDTFKDLIQDDFVLVDFFAQWCGPCKMLGPVLEELSQERTDLKIVKMDTDQTPNLSREFGIMSVPTLILFKKGKPVSTQYGFLPKPLLIKWIEENQ